jgi:outer membrane protein assembly factor BamB
MPHSKPSVWLQRVTVLGLCLALLASCATTSDHAPAAAGATIEHAWSADVDHRQPRSPQGFSLPTTVGRGSSALVVSGGRDGWAHILDAGGAEVRRVSLDAPCDSGAATLANGLVVLGDVKAVLYGIDPQTGTIRWRFQLSAPLVGTPVVAGNDVLVQTSDNRLYRISADGHKQWSVAEYATGLGFYLSSSPLLHDGVVYAFFVNGDAVAVNAANGDLLWRKQLLLDADAAVLSELKAPVARPTYFSQLVLDGIPARDVVLFPFYQGEMFALAHTDGSQTLRHSLSLKSSPLQHDGLLYMAASDGSLQAINMASGQIMWKQQLSGRELLGPVFWQGALWVAATDGTVYRLDLDGHVQGKVKLPGRVDRTPVAGALGVLVKTDLGALHLLH